MRIIKTKTCLNCPILIEKGYFQGAKRWAETKYCSIKCRAENPEFRALQARKHEGQTAWNKGIPQTEEVKKKLSESLKVISKEKGFGQWMTGKKDSLEARRSKSIAAKRVIAEGRHNFYVDGRTPLNKALRSSYQYRLWREAVFKRDNWTCQGEGCGKRGCKLNADHIKSWRNFPELRFAIDNGQTLCVPCHEKTPNFKGKALTSKI